MQSNKCVLLLTRYARNGASSRYRTFQYLPCLEQAGIHCKVMPLFDEAYLAHRYQSGRGHLGDILRVFVRRLAALVTARRFDLLVEKEVLQLYHLFIEKPLIRLFRQQISRLGAA